ncbi:class I SAM-dependent methyltransferase [Xylophilus rhododendri]|uniref:Class I SAM-dependent methyltransferase n=1 Tax=Xylophilus rhododendri TaxID=2697032 RepID=A0A857JDP9_9BURK|nr:class I SAM-dependent methyltransferase [Xylophilus rhododendri]QHJ01332.1 class I SAM-dependent methyltransferase [Xylophilus rhododendri]
MNPIHTTAADGNPLLDYFMRNGGNAIHKWVDYFEVYHRAFARFRGREITFVEIGVQNGGSLHMWRDYLGPQARIIGVDVDENCKALKKHGFDIWIGDQADPAFWRKFCKENPDIDVVLDDGGHTMVQQINTFDALFPVLRNGGCYLCEDTHTSYFPAHGGGVGRTDTFLDFAKGLVDEMHAWYHAPLESLDHEYIAQHLYSLSFFDSIVVMEKRRRNSPLILARGHDGHIKNPPAMTHVEMRRVYGVAD